MAGRMVLAFISILMGFQQLHAAEAVPAPWLSEKRWNAQWINDPSSSAYDYGVYFFRKSIDLESVPETYVVNVSADNGYKLYVNGTELCNGPARGDLDHWFYETVDIAPYLKSGRNTVAAAVWNFGEGTAGAQITWKTGFVLQENAAGKAPLNTNGSWKVIRSQAYSPIFYPETSYDVGTFEDIDASKYPWGWKECDFDDSSWNDAREISQAQPYGLGVRYHWVMQPRGIPLMENTPTRLARVRRISGAGLPPAGWLEGKSAWRIPAGSKLSVLLDNDVETSAYLELLTSGGRGSSIKLTYAEALYKNGKKGNRNEIDGYEIRGYHDVLRPDGGSKRIFKTLWFRAYRYIQLDIETAGEELVIDDIRSYFRSFPYKERAWFHSDDPQLEKIWEVGWRTARLCAHDAFFDCPYWEQLQYANDTRIQSLISLYVTGDDRLVRRAIEHFDWSRGAEGLTSSRYPTRTRQIIPPVSLYWINQIHDYWMICNDNDFVRERIPGINTVLEWFVNHLDKSTGMMGPVPHWAFIDWAVEWPRKAGYPSGGVPPGAIGGGSSIITLQLLYTLRQAVEMFDVFGYAELADRYRPYLSSLGPATVKLCWNADRGLMADDIEASSYSQHSNIWAVLSDAIPQSQQPALYDKIKNDGSLIQGTFFYRFYLIQAMKKLGMEQDYLSLIQPWRDMLSMGLTTFAETPEPTRSDCHAWASSPNYDLIATVAGIEPSSPNFKSVRIRPSLGSLTEIDAACPHYLGLVRLKVKKGRRTSDIQAELPKGLGGTLEWGGESFELSEGTNNFRLKNEK